MSCSLVIVGLSEKVDRQIGASFAVLQVLLWSIMVQTELNHRAMLFIYQSDYNPALTKGCEIWIITKEHNPTWHI